MTYDQIFKELIQEMLREFLLLFYPDVAARIDFSEVIFLDKEGFTDLLEGQQREADIIAQVRTLDGEPEVLLIHTEFEAQWRSAFAARMFEYYAIFRRRTNLPIFPIALFLSPGAGGLTEESYVETLFGREILRFTYGVIGIRDLEATDYLAGDNPLGHGLSSLMRPGEAGPVEQKIAALKKIATSGQNDARKAMLAHIVEKYRILNEVEQTQYEARLQQEDAKEVETMMNIFEERGLVKGEENERRRSILKVLRHKFGELPEAIVAQIEAITSSEEFDTLFDRALDAETLTDFRAVEKA